MPGDEISERVAGAPERDPARKPRAGSIRLWAAFAFVLAIWLAAAMRWIVTDTVVPWDSKNQFYAFFRFLASAIHSGASPFWNPYHYGGHPAVADPQSLIFARCSYCGRWLTGRPRFAHSISWSTRIF